MPLAWSYCRTSTARQAAADRSGMGRQEAALAGWMAEHPEYVLQEALVDGGVSAGKGKNRTRGALSRFIEGGRSGLIPPGSCLVVESMSRFTREAERSALETLLRDVWGKGLAIAFAEGDGAVLTAEVIDREPHRLYGLLGAISQARAEWLERSRRSKGAAAKARRLQDEGGRPPGRRPFWIDRDAAGDLSLSPVYQGAIDRAVELALGGFGMVLIADHLTAENFPAPPTMAANQYRPAFKTGWSAGQVSRLLRHPALTGTLQRLDGTALPGFYPAAITPEKWEQLRSSVDARNLLKGRLRGKSHRAKNLFQTLLRCGCCGGPIGYAAPAARARKGHPGYVVCRNGARGLSGCTMRGHIEYDNAEAHCLGRLGATDWEALLHRPDHQQERLALELAMAKLQIQQKQQQKQLERAQERAEQAWLAGVDETRLTTIEGAMERLRTALTATGVELAGTRQELAMATARPQGIDQAASMRKRISEFVRHLETADGPQRLAFNRWLLAREPTIEFQLHPEAKVELLVGGESLGQRLILPLSDRLAVHAGMARRQVLLQRTAIAGADLDTSVITDDFEAEADARQRLHDQAHQDLEVAEAWAQEGWVPLDPED